MRSFRLLGLLVALAFFLPACGNFSPTDVPAQPEPALELGDDECDPQDRNDAQCAFGFIGSGG
jgi:hypothetical protein